MKCECGKRPCQECGHCDCSPWISVEDRLPEDGKYVLTYHYEDDHISVGYFESENVSFYIEKDGSKFYTDRGWETEIPWAQKGEVTHWMLLPELPKE